MGKLSLLAGVPVIVMPAFSTGDDAAAEKKDRWRRWRASPASGR